MEHTELADNKKAATPRPPELESIIKKVSKVAQLGRPKKPPTPPKPKKKKRHGNCKTEAQKRATRRRLAREYNKRQTEQRKMDARVRNAFAKKARQSATSQLEREDRFTAARRRKIATLQRNIEKMQATLFEEAKLKGDVYKVEAAIKRAKQKIATAERELKRLQALQAKADANERISPPESPAVAAARKAAAKRYRDRKRAELAELRQAELAFQQESALFQPGDVIEIPQPDGTVRLRKVGKIKYRKNWLPYAEARAILHSEQVQSVWAYDRWWLANRPQRIPRYPAATYKDWISWNDFLGNPDNKYMPKMSKRYRPLAEAAAWARRLKIATKSQWLDTIKQMKESGTFPEDIPSRPDLAYIDWISWYQFLGTRVSDKVESVQEHTEMDPSVFYVAHYSDDPSNVYRVAINKLGVSGIMEEWEKAKDFRVVRMYRYHPTLLSKIQQVLEATSSAYYGEQTVRLVQMLPALLTGLEAFLDVVQPPS